MMSPERNRTTKTYRGFWYSVLIWHTPPYQTPIITHVTLSHNLCYIIRPNVTYRSC